MTDEGFRHKLTPEQRRMTDRQLAATLPEGTGLSVAHFGPFWDVLLRAKDGKVEYIVTDSSTGPDHKPQRVYGPVKDRKDAEAWARSTSSIFLMTKRQQPTWPWEG